MSLEQNQAQFFLGANAPQGFVSRFDQLCRQDWRCFILKGAPGLGKSTLMRQAAALLQDRCENIEYILCSSDPHSLDAVLFHDLKIAIADGTSPHVIEPMFPGVCERVVQLSDCLDDDSLFQLRDEIIPLYLSGMHTGEQASRYLSAAAALLGDTYRIALECTDAAKIARFAQRVASREFKRTGDRKGTEHFRFLSAFTGEGCVTLDHTARLLAERIYFLEDDWGASSRLLLYHLRTLALDAGYDVITCQSPLYPDDRMEHLFIPQLSLGFMSVHFGHRPALEPYKVVNARRFTDQSAIKLRKKRISFNRKAALQMLEQATLLLFEGMENHRCIEGYYASALDYEHLDQLADGMLRRLVRMADEALPPFEG